MKEFRKYSSIENSYRGKHIDRWTSRYPELYDCEYIATEKIHGSNFSVNIFNEDGVIDVIFGKRTALLSPEDAFFDHQNTMNQEKEKLLIERLSNYVKDNNMNSMRVYGELFGQGVQKFDYLKIDTKNKKTFRVFDIIINERTLTPKQAIALLMTLRCEDMYVPIMGFFHKLQDALDMDINFISNFSSDECKYPAEGVVIRPFEDDISYIDKDTNKDISLVLKKKNEEFGDKNSKKEKVVVKERSPEFNKLFNEYTSLITPARIESAFSKHGKIEDPSQIGKYIKIVLEDCKEDFFKDYLDEFKFLSDDEKKGMFATTGREVSALLKRCM